MMNKLVILLLIIFTLTFSFACACPNGLEGPAGADKIKASNNSLNDRGYFHYRPHHARR